MHIPGYVRGNLATPRLPVVRAETTVGSVDVFTGLKPTVAVHSEDAPPVILQGFHPMWVHNATLTLNYFHWFTDELFLNVTVVAGVIVLNLGPILCGGCDGPTHQKDLLFPIPPPGILRIPLASVPMSWTPEQTISRTSAAIRRVSIWHGRDRSRKLRRIIFMVMRFVRPEQTTLVLAECPFLDFMRAVVGDLSKATEDTRFAATMQMPDPSAPADPERFFRVAYTATPSRNSAVSPICAVFPIVHCV